MKQRCTAFFVLILLLIFTFHVIYKSLLKEHSVVENVDLYTVSSKEAIKMKFPKHYPGFSKIESTIPGLYIEEQEINDHDWTTTVAVFWNKLKKTMIIDETAGIDCNWRPNHSGFFYTNLYRSYIGCKEALHYVEIKNMKSHLLTTDEIINLKDLESYSNNAQWSKDGRFFCWPYYSRIDIFEFDSGKSWSVKSLVIHDGLKKTTIKCPSKPMIINVEWTKDNRYFWFELYKDRHHEKPIYQGTIKISQFGLRKK